MAGKRECAGDRLATRSGNLKKHQGGRPEAYFNERTSTYLRR
jgi:hypothetical protein